MRVIKNINNNVSVCMDDNGNEIVAFGKGIGFVKPPYEIDDGRVEKIYYGIDHTYISMINAIPADILSVADKIISYAKLRLNRPINSNIIITLADHIQFAIKRYEQNMDIELPIINDIKHLYAAEMDVGEYGYNMIRREIKVELPPEEAAYIALHIINAEAMEGKAKKGHNDTDMINDITEIIETFFDSRIDRKGFNYSRFVSHMHYLLKRVRENKLIEEKNSKLYFSLVEDWKQIYACCEKISEYLSNALKKELTNEERLYLMLHINRLCEREDAE